MWPIERLYLFFFFFPISAAQSCQRSFALLLILFYFFSIGSEMHGSPGRRRGNQTDGSCGNREHESDTETLSSTACSRGDTFTLQQGNDREKELSTEHFLGFFSVSPSLSQIWWRETNKTGSVCCGRTAGKHGFIFLRLFQNAKVRHSGFLGTGRNLVEAFLQRRPTARKSRVRSSALGAFWMFYWCLHFTTTVNLVCPLTKGT